MDQNEAQNTSLDSVTKKQPKPSLKSRYESKTRFSHEFGQKTEKT